MLVGEAAPLHLLPNQSPADDAQLNFGKATIVFADVRFKIGRFIFNRFRLGDGRVEVIFHDPFQHLAGECAAVFTICKANQHQFMLRYDG